MTMSQFLLGRRTENVFQYALAGTKDLSLVRVVWVAKYSS